MLPPAEARCRPFCRPKEKSVRFLNRTVSRRNRANVTRLWGKLKRKIDTAIFLLLLLSAIPGHAILSLRHAKGVDDHGQICSEGQAEQESSEGTEPSAANDVELQPRYQDR